MRDLHERLTSLGHAPPVDATSTYGDATAALVEAFQRSRGLPITGDVDAMTWTRLDEARWRVGQRLLYLTPPYFRGDDVAEIQVRLAQLGFNPGRIDGIFGPTTAHALADFQRNCGQDDDGVLTKSTLLELIRMGAVASHRQLVTEARDVAGFDDAQTGSLVLCGDSPLTARIADAVGGAFAVDVLDKASADEVAAFANQSRAAVVLSFANFVKLHVVHMHYWASYHSHSRRSERLASSLATEFSLANELPRVEVTGMALPILRETHMTTLHIEHGHHSVEDLQDLAEATVRVLSRVIHRSL